MIRGGGMRAIRLGGGLFALLLGCPAPAPAQESASPLLPAEHWAARAAWRAEALGLAPGYFPAARSVPRAAVAAALDEAAARAPSGSPHAALATAWLERFREEFTEYRDGGGEAASLVRLGGTVAGGYGTWTGRLSPARGLRDSRVAPVVVADEDGVRARAAGTGVVGRNLALHVEAVIGGGSATVPRWEAVAEAGGVALSVGRSEIGYGPAMGGGIVLSTAEPLGRVQVQTTRPFRLPLLGRVTAHTFATRLDDGRHVERPWLWGARIAVRPHDRVTVGVNRASMFGGDSTRTTVRRIAGMLVGVLQDGFENQVVSVDGRWRLPTDPTLPATLYLEWGAEDAAGAWVDSPALSGGVLLPALPGAPWAALGAEATRFAPCCGHGAWYTHTGFRGNWASRDFLLGHPVGGAGTEVAVYARAEPPRLPLRLDARFFVRDRAAVTPGVSRAGNLFAQTGAGRGVGGELRADLRLTRRAELGAAFYRDATGEMRERRAEAELRYRF